jgi:TorA maturation chaperone TorD
MGSRSATHSVAVAAARADDDVEAARAREYNLLATLLAAAPDRELLERLGRLTGDSSPVGAAHGALAAAAAEADPAVVNREYFKLFVGVGRGELLPYASYYLTGFLNERPLAAVRRDLGVLGLARGDGRHDPEDHAAFLCEVMAELATGDAGAPGLDQEAFFARHLRPWAGRFFADLEGAEAARFYRAVGALGATFMAVEAEAFALDASLTA